MTEKTRWKIAHLLNRSRRLCWADLVTWALGWHGIRECAVSNLCHQGRDETGSCYCGKLRAEGEQR